MALIRTSPMRLTLFLLRIAVALIFLWHGVPKALDASAAMEKFVGFGLPGWLGPVVGWAEVPAALVLLLGLWHRAAAGLLGVIILGAIATVQLPGGITAGLERDMLILVAALVLFTNGPGAYALGARATGRSSHGLLAGADSTFSRARCERRRKCVSAEWVSSP